MITQTFSLSRFPHRDVVRGDGRPTYRRDKGLVGGTVVILQ